VLASYGIRCCISGIAVPRLLVASHIKPWSTFSDCRLNPRNGLCLSSIHDAAFEAGLITLDKHLQLVVSPKLKSFFLSPILEENFARFEGKPIRPPDKLAEPEPSFISFHRRVIFQK
jgi:putative restriction endonuclease